MFVLSFEAQGGRIVSAFDSSPFEKKRLNFLHLYELWQNS